MKEKNSKKVDLADNERKALVERIFIKFPRLNGLLEKIAYCHEHSKIAAEPECLLITGYQGAGKTTLCREYARRYPTIITREKKIVPVLATFVPSITTKKGLPTKLLNAL